MYAQIIELVKALLLSPGLKAEYDAYEQDFRGNLTVNAKDLNGNTIPLLLNHPLTVEGFAQVDTSEPPRNPGGPYPRAYVYHLMSEYPEKEQEYDLVNGVHRIGLSFFAAGQIASDAEQIAGRMTAASKKYIERNQYMFGALPRAVGASTVAFYNSIVPGMQLPKLVIPYHGIMVVKIKELRNV
jgi:hypothetical protein